MSASHRRSARSSRISLLFLVLPWIWEPHCPLSLVLGCNTYCCIPDQLRKHLSCTNILLLLLVMAGAIFYPHAHEQLNLNFSRSTHSCKICDGVLHWGCCYFCSPVFYDAGQPTLACGWLFLPLSRRGSTGFICALHKCPHALPSLLSSPVKSQCTCTKQTFVSLFIFPLQRVNYDEFSKAGVYQKGKPLEEEQPVCVVVNGTIAWSP